MVTKSATQRFGTARLVGALVVLVVLVAAAATTKRVPTSIVDQLDPNAFDPATYSIAAYSDTVDPYVAANAIDLVELLEALQGGADEADYGNAPGAASSYSFPVQLTGIAGEVKGPVLPVTVAGVDGVITVQIQVGPALNGTALRDVSGTISFNEFTNQLEYQKIGTELNNIVRSDVLVGIDPTTLNGQEITVTGAFTRVNPKLVSVMPTVFEVGP